MKPEAHVRRVRTGAYSTKGRACQAVKQSQDLNDGEATGSRLPWMLYCPRLRRKEYLKTSSFASPSTSRNFHCVGDSTEYDSLNGMVLWCLVYMDDLQIHVVTLTALVALPRLRQFWVFQGEGFALSVLPFAPCVPSLPEL